MNTRYTPSEYTYVVFGAGQFPNDMLRYDRARLIGGPFRREHFHVNVPGNDRWSYYLIRGKSKPTIGRWNSFLWGVHVIDSNQE